MVRRLVTLVALAVVALVLARRAGLFLVVVDPLPARADAIVMLAGAPEDRLLEVADIFARGIAPRIILTRERLPASAVHLARRGVRLPEEHELAQWALRDLGVPADAIDVLRHRASSTTTEADVLARHACRTGIRTLIVVTSPTHTRRARLILRHALGSDATVVMRPARAAYFPARRWWRRRHTAKRVLFEYQKLLNFWLCERWSTTTRCEES